MSDLSTFESDLRAAREANGLSLAEIQHQTRIPIDVLRRFEDGRLVNDPTYNEVYLKAFLRSYAKSIGVPATAAVAAYTAAKSGQYDGSLNPDADASGAAPSATRRDQESASDRASDATESRPNPAPAGAAPAVEALASTPAPERRPASAPPKTLAQARVNRPAVTDAKHSFDKNWGAILGLFGILVAVLAGAFYVLIFASDDEPSDGGTEVAEVGEEADAVIDTAGVGTAALSGPRFQLPIVVTVTANGNGLQSFRATEDAETRRPYWVEPGQSQTFEGDSLVALFGEDPSGDFSEAVVEIQGQRFVPQSGRVLTISAANGQALLDSLVALPDLPVAAEPTSPEGE
ncbi:MAG: helix-turn-helix transcriptional regulator [Bacteroidota bacterium]